MIEQWIPVPAMRDRYEVSDLGRVRSYAGKKIKFLTPAELADGTQIVKLYKYGFGVTHRVHRLVWFCFKSANADQVRHKDGDRRNNKLTNLEAYND